MKAAIALIETVLERRPYCPNCSRHLYPAEVAWNYGYPYHNTGYCRDADQSNLITADERLLTDALNRLRAAQARIDQALGAHASQPTSSASPSSDHQPE